MEVYAGGSRWTRASNAQVGAAGNAQPITRSSESVDVDAIEPESSSAQQFASCLDSQRRAVQIRDR